MLYLQLKWQMYLCCKSSRNNFARHFHANQQRKVTTYKFKMHFLESNNTFAFLTLKVRIYDKKTVVNKVCNSKDNHPEKQRDIKIMGCDIVSWRRHHDVRRSVRKT